MLQELTEEWEQCEHKLKETQSWAEKSRLNLTSSQSRKQRPIRDQLSSCEKTSAEVSVQKTKATMAVEKLKVHFDRLSTSDDGQGQIRDVHVLEQKIQTDLATLFDEIKSQMASLEVCLAQLDQYQQVCVPFCSAVTNPNHDSNPMEISRPTNPN